MVMRRVGVGVAALLAAVLTASCAAGQHAATSEEVPAVDASHGILGPIYLENVAIHAPHGPASYKTGQDVVLQAVIVNNGHHPDTLTGITTTAFTGWGVFTQSQATVVTTADQASGQTGTVTPPKGATTQVIDPDSSVALGLTDVGADGTSSSPSTILLLKLAKASAPLFPAAQIKITFTFANAGAKTLTVPVQLSANPNHATVPPLPTSSG
jgi:copper(I)-binding protein